MRTHTTHLVAYVYATDWYEKLVQCTRVMEYSTQMSVNENALCDRLRRWCRSSCPPTCRCVVEKCCECHQPPCNCNCSQPRLIELELIQEPANRGQRPRVQIVSTDPDVVIYRQRPFWLVDVSCMITAVHSVTLRPILCHCVSNSQLQGTLPLWYHSLTYMVDQCSH